MTEVHVFGVVSAADGAPSGARTIAHGDVAAIVNEAQPGRTVATALLRAHSRILEEVARRGDGAARPLRHRDGGRPCGRRRVPRSVARRARGQARRAGGQGPAVGEGLLRGGGAAARRGRGVARRSRACASGSARCPRTPATTSASGSASLSAQRSSVRASVTPPSCSGGSRRSPWPRRTSRSRRAIPPSTPPSWSNGRGSTSSAPPSRALGKELAGRMRLRYVGPQPPYSFAGDDARPGVPAWA